MKNSENTEADPRTVVTGFSQRVADMSADEKPREKCERFGIKSLSVVELIAITLGSGLPGKSVVDLSREIMQACDNKPARLASMTVSQLCREFKGVGKAKAISLLAAIELGMRVSAEQGFSDCPVIRSSEDVASLMGHRLKFIDHEQFWILLLDRRNHVREVHQLSAGGTAATVVDPKLLFRYALEHGASGIVAVHNHPSGNLQPSAEDDRLTKRLRSGAELLDIRFLDHLIIAEGGFYSYADNGRLC